MCRHKSAAARRQEPFPRCYLEFMRQVWHASAARKQGTGTTPEDWPGPDNDTGWNGTPMNDDTPQPKATPSWGKPPPSPLLKGTAEKILHMQRWTERLFSFRLSRPAAFRFQPGQFARLGLDGPLGSTIWRPYSMVSTAYDEHLDFFSIQVPDGAFTSRLATCKVGDTVYVEKTAYGYLTTSRFVGGSNLWLLATGTGIAPFLSILRDPAVWAQYEHIVLAYSVRQAADLAYRDEIAALPQHPLWAEQGHKLRFVPIITREQLPGTLSQRLDRAISDGSLETAAQLTLGNDSRILLCGNPQMLDDVRAALSARGLRPDLGRAPGHFASENYW